jgi:hypothetical protein
MTLEELSEVPVLDVSHHTRTNLSLPLEDRLNLEDHSNEMIWNHQYEFAKSLLEDVHKQLGIEPPTEEESLIAEFTPPPLEPAVFIA